MDIKTKLLKLEGRKSRYALFTIFLLWSSFQGIEAYNNYRDLFIENSIIGSEGYLTLTFLWSANVVLCLSGLIFFGNMDATVKKKERYLIINDDEIFIPNAVSKKVKHVLFSNIESFTSDGITQSSLKINLKSNSNFFLPRIYDCYEIDVKELYRALNERLVEVNKKDN